MATVSDYARVTENLQLVYEKDHADNFFDFSCDAFMAMCEEQAESDNGGAGYVLQLVGKGSQNANPTYALKGTGAPVRDQWTFPAVNLEWSATWSRDAQLSAETKGVKGMFDLAKEEIDIAMRVECKDKLGLTMGGDGWGSLAGISAVTTGASGTIDLCQPGGAAASAVVAALTNRFYVGQIICSVAVAGSSTARGSTPGDQAVVTIVNANTGRVTFTSVPATFAAGDTLFEYGYRPYDAASGRNCVMGVEAWLPPVVATDTFGGKSRNNRADLQPLRFDAVSMTVKEGLINADRFFFTQRLASGENPVYFVAPDQFSQLTVGEESKKVIPMNVERTNSKGEKYTIGFQAYQLQGMRGIVPVIPSAFIRPGIAFYGPFQSKMKGFKLKYSGKALINITTGPDGNAFYLVQGGITDNSGKAIAGYRSEGFFRGQLTCKHPGNYGVVNNLAE